MNASSNQELEPLIRKLETTMTLTDDERDAILRLPVYRMSLSAHTDIIRDGEVSKQCCVILTGWAFRYKILKSGKRQVLSFHIPGEIPDLHSMHLPKMDHSLSALRGCTAGFIPHEALLNLTTQFSQVAGALWRDTLIDASIFREWMTNIGQRSAKSRLAHLFCELYTRFKVLGLEDGFSIPLPLSQAEIADALGITIAHVNRVLQALRIDSLVTLKGHQLVILDWKGLAKIADFDPDYLHLSE
ncbi:Crp/Fnr family transcriptional regulator [Methylobacterium sp. CM6247]